LIERGDSEALVRHADFRLFGCMNPPTDFGKKDLPPAIRGRFTEFYVEDIVDREDLAVIVESYLRGASPKLLVDEVVSFYLKAREMAASQLVDGENRAPYYSLRTLCRGLDFARNQTPVFGFDRALYEGLVMSFTTPLVPQSRQLLDSVIIGELFALPVKANGSNMVEVERQRDTKRAALLKVGAKPPTGSGEYVQLEGFWIPRGEEKEEKEAAAYVVDKSVPTVAARVKLLARVALSRKYPILLQGPTSSGKTSLVQHLARITQHKFVRINNHEHTDLQEYMGSYVSDANGKLKFQEGVLVQAVRNGWWIVLDELNLAPSEVLEALNRLLDDNRELFIPETSQTVRPHPSFLLFATQNPPGLYGGRKVLSRAFRNRFVSLHVDDIPKEELKTILMRRCQLPPSGSRSGPMVEVMTSLQKDRHGTNVFTAKEAVTTRDLFRWGMSHRDSNNQTLSALAHSGYMLLAERLRTPEGKARVQAVLKKELKDDVKEDALYSVAAIDAITNEFKQSKIAAGISHGLDNVAWTAGMRRLFILVNRCLKQMEPALLVGDTGCGKTTVCQLFSVFREQKLVTINCHQHTETSDFLGGLRPIRGKERLAVDLRIAFRHFATLTTSIKGVTSPELTPAVVDDTTNTLQVLHNRFHQLCKRFASPDAVAAATTASVKTPAKKGKESKESKAMDTGNDEAAPSTSASDKPIMNAEVIASKRRVDQVWKSYQALFEWHDGPLVQAMRNGDLLLIDEINLAEDAVLERLNSVLEPERQLVLAEKGGKVVEVITAHPNFRIVCTMNPGGDVGKKELSPALRNRFTEIWVPTLSNEADLLQIITERFTHKSLTNYSRLLLDFIKWFNGHDGHRKSLSLRDILAWVAFMNASLTASASISDDTGDVKISADETYLHGARLVVLDGLGIGTGDSESTTEALRIKCETFLFKQIPSDQVARVRDALVNPRTSVGDASVPDHLFGISPFFIKRGSARIPDMPYALNAATTRRNLLRVLRAMQLPKAILLEGSPGVGKTSLLTALAAATGHRIVRINLSEQTDMMDLLGMDLPVHGGKGGEFAWCDGVFLQALKAGDWVLLDELNLASQSVLEGLNAVLDHRAVVYIPELDREFVCPPTFRVFACQNPMSQGGGRKGLPASFLNRFTKVYLNSLDRDDLLHISTALYPNIPRDTLERMIAFNTCVHDDTMVHRRYGHKGSPWEFNLRDVFRWCDLIKQAGVAAARALRDPNATTPVITGASGGDARLASPGAYLDLVYLQRMRTDVDRDHIIRRYQEIFGAGGGMNRYPLRVDHHPSVHMTERVLQVGAAIVPRRQYGVSTPSSTLVEALHEQSRSLEMLMKCVELAWPITLIGSAASGKTSLVRLLAAATGNQLHEFAMSSSADSTELLGCFEQVDLSAHKRKLLMRVNAITKAISSHLLGNTHEVSLPSKDTSSSLASVRKLFDTWSMLSSSTSRKSASSSTPTTNGGKTVTQLSANGSVGSEEVSTAGFDSDQDALLTSLLSMLQGLVQSHRIDLVALGVASDAPHVLLKLVQQLKRMADKPDGVVGHFGELGLVTVWSIVSNSHDYSFCDWCNRMD
jgi:midasin